jgi:hypothetical protein
MSKTILIHDEGVGFWGQPDKATAREIWIMALLGDEHDELR